MIAALALLAALAGPGAADTPASATPVQSPARVVPAAGQKVTNLTVYGSDPCPRGGDNEIVVCARRPEGERYRIPPNLRHKKPIPAEGSWTNNVSMLDDISRQQMVPGSCSVNGINGQTGCTHQMLHQWYLDRQEQKREQAEDAAGAAASADAKVDADTDPGVP